jgi:hypothetical protein
VALKYGLIFWVACLLLAACGSRPADQSATLTDDEHSALPLVRPNFEFPGVITGLSAYLASGTAAYNADEPLCIRVENTALAGDPSIVVYIDARRVSDDEFTVEAQLDETRWCFQPELTPGTPHLLYVRLNTVRGYEFYSWGFRVVG